VTQSGRASNARLFFCERYRELNLLFILSRYPDRDSLLSQATYTYPQVTNRKSQFNEMKRKQHADNNKRPHQGADYSAPYPVSRMAPSFELVNLAEEISQADTTLAAHASGKLRLIAK